MNTSFLNEHRCKCGKLLLKGIFFDAAVEIKCKKCGEINKIGHIKLADDGTHYLMIINNHGVVTNVSDSACSILGYNGDELIGKHFAEINPTLPKEVGQKFFGPESVLSENGYFQLDTFHQSKDGKKIPIAVFLKLYQPTNKEKHILLAAEVKNSASNDKDADAPEFIENACDFFFCLDKNGIVEYVSPSVEKLFGFSQERTIGKSYLDFVPEKTREEAKRNFEHFSKDAQPYRVAHDPGRDASGKPIHNEVYFTPKFDDGGKFTGYRVLGWILKEY